MELVIFDLDGVIVSTDKHHYQAWKALAEEYNLLFSFEINHMLRGVSRAESLKIILDVNRLNVDPNEFAAMLDKKNNLYRQKLQSLTHEEIRSGVLELIGDLKQNGIKVAVGSSSRNASLILERIGLSDAFDVIIDGNQIENSKPHPEVFIKCAQMLDIESEKCVVFEDAKAGIDAALQANMVAIGVGEEHLAKADAMIKDLSGMTYEAVKGIYKEKNSNCGILQIGKRYEYN